MAIKSRPKYTSKNGLGGRLSGKAPEKSALDIELNKFNAFKQGKKVYVTIPNPNEKETNKRFIRVEMKSLYGDFRNY